MPLLYLIKTRVSWTITAKDYDGSDMDDESCGNDENDDGNEGDDDD